MIRSLELAKWSIPERYCKLTLYEGRRSLKANNVLSFLTKNAKISFSTSETVSGAISETNISITGLKKETMLYLATSFNQWTNNIINNQLILEAGYSNLHGVIFDGEIIEAIPNLESADYTIQLKCISYYSTMINDNFSLTFSGHVPASQIASAIASKSGYLLQNSLKEDVLVSNYTNIDKSASQHVRALAQMSGLDVWITSGGRLNIKNVGEPIDSVKPFIVDSRNMIGSPEPTALGAKVKIKLNPSVQTGQAVTLISEKFPQINSSGYILQTFSHSGDTKGAKWQTELNLIRSNIYGK